MKYLVPVLILLLLPLALASTHDGYSTPRAGFSASTSVSVEDTAVYKTGYVSENGSQWTAFTLSGSKQRGDWVLGTASSDVDLAGIQYVAIFSCTWNDAWDCSETWQVRDRGIQNTINSLQGDHDALMALYDSTNGDSWDNNDGWGGGPETMGSWYGVETDANGRVISIKLNGNEEWEEYLVQGAEGEAGGNGLTGTLPAGDVLGNLKHVKYFNVKNNDLTGELPDGLWKMTDLTHLLLNGRASDMVIDRNQHPGKPPGGSWADERSNKFTGELPAEVSNLKDLQWLEIAATGHPGDGLESLPDSVGQLDQLRGLHAGFNQFESLPDSLGDLKQLRHLDLQRQGDDDRALAGEGFPQWVGDLHNLKNIWIMNNEDMGGTLPDVSQAKNLSIFLVNGNDLTGALPPALSNGSLPDMNMVQLSWNDFSGPLPDFSGPHNLAAYTVAYNYDLTGPIPDSFWDADSMINTNFDRNGHTGTLPADLTNMGRIRNLRVAHNYLHGPIPNMDWSNNDFTRANLQQNYFTFADFLRDIDGTPLFELYDNHEPLGDFHYSPQRDMGDARSASLDPGDDEVIDDFVEVFTHPDNVYQWQKDGEDLAGETDAQLAIEDAGSADEGAYRLRATNPGVPGLTLTSEPVTLSVTDASTDSVQGDHDALMALYDATDGDGWDDNTGWGGDASTMGSWYGIETDGDGRVISVKLNGNTGWDIEYFKGEDGVQGGNNLDGTLPAELGNLKRVRYFNVKQNQLSGELPPEIGDMESLEVLLLNGRTWDPEPGERKHHNGKTSTDGGSGIDEKTNLYSGSIPASFGDLSNLRVLELIGQREDTDTGVEGPIPPELGQLSNLEALHLAFNELSGELPDEIYGMENLIAIDITRNELEGQIPASINETWTNMEYMSLGVNDFSGEMPVLSNLRNLKYFGVKGNELTGSLAWMEDVNWTQELTFTFDFNDDFYDDSLGFSGRIPELDTLNDAVVLHLQGNKFTGEIPDSVTGMWRVIILTFAWNDLSGELPQTGWEDFSSRVRHFTMNSNQLTGNIPGGLIESADNEDLQNLRFSNNDFTSMDVNAADNLQNGEIQIGNNKLTFKDFVTSDGRIPSRVSGHTSQRPFGQSRTINANSGSEVTINDFETNLQHADNSYQWTLDGSAISGANSRTLTLNNVDSGDAGEYVLEVTNSNVGGLTLTSETITVNVS